jgi:hypothetical protein
MREPVAPALRRPATARSGEIAMRVRSILPVLAVLLLLSALSRGSWSLTAVVGSPDLVISQVYGGGGNTGAPYTNKFVELFNRGSSPVALAGKSVQYASATGTGTFSTSLVALPAATVAAGGYFLIHLAGGANGSPLPAADAVGTFNPAATAGKFVLVSTSTGLTCNGGSTPCTASQLGQIVDLVGYGSANFFEGSAAAATLSATTAALRADDGCADTNDNAADFHAAQPVPRNSSTALHACTTIQPTPTPPATPLPPTPAPTPEITPEPTAEPTPESTPEPTPVITPEPTPEMTPEVTPEVTPEPTAEITPEPTPEVTPEVTPEPTPEPTPEITPEPTPQITPAPTPKVTPQPTPEITPGPTPQPTFAFSGFAPPVANLPSTNVVKAGSAVPIKFSLGGNFGLNVVVGGWLSSLRHSCTSIEASAPLEPTSAAGASGLSYDPFSDTYTYVWKTSRDWSGTCQTLVLALVDGSQHYAEFAFR